MSVDLRLGDCRRILDELDDASIDSCVTDPPYALVSISKRFGKPGRTDSIWSRSGPHQRMARGFMGKTWDTGDVAHDPAFWAEVLRVLKPGAHLLAFGGTRTYHRLACAVEDAGFEIRDQIGWAYGSGFPKSHNQRGEWEGWGTALKPAWEPIVMARKPLVGTVESNLIAFGTGAINIEACRVPFADPSDEEEAKTKNRHADFGSGPMSNQVFGKFTKDRDNYDAVGRWPANLLHDGSGEVLDFFPNGAGRFFYCAKASRADRDDGLAGFEKKPLLWSAGEKNPGSFQSAGTDKSARNPHPTVKPTALMRYLCRLVTPPGGTVLDPFMGSGSTGRGAVLEGFDFIGMEMEAEYATIARARIAAARPAPLTEEEMLS